MTENLCRVACKALGEHIDNGSHDLDGRLLFIVVGYDRNLVAVRLGKEKCLQTPDLVEIGEVVLAASFRHLVAPALQTFFQLVPLLYRQHDGNDDRILPLVDTIHQ